MKKSLPSILTLLIGVFLFAGTAIGQDVECPDNSVVSQPPVNSFGCSPSDMSEGRIAIEFLDVDYPAGGAVFYASLSTLDFEGCVLDTLDYELNIHKDLDGLPGEVIYSKIGKVVGEDTGLDIWGDSTMSVLSFTVEFDELLVLEHGWISFSSTDDANGCIPCILIGENGVGSMASDYFGTFEPFNVPGFGAFCLMAEQVDTLTPYYVSNFEVSPDANGALEATIEWNNPTEDVNGNPLTDLDFVHLYVNDVLEHTIADPVIGGAESYTFMPTANDFYSFRVYGSNSAGDGFSVIKHSFIGLDVPAAPTNLDLDNVNEEGQISWTAPTEGLNGGYFDGVVSEYKIKRSPDGAEFTVAGTEASFLDNTIPGVAQFTYHITAYNASGEGGTAATEGAYLGGGVSRDLVILEESTGTWCVFCPGAQLGVEELLDEDYPIAGIAYHGEDAYEIPESTQRLNYYEMVAFPTTRVDGVLEYRGGDPAVSIAWAYKPLVEERMEAPTPITIAIENKTFDGTTLTADVKIDAVANVIFENTSLQVALTESHIPEVWQSLDELNHVLRQMYNGAEGTPVDLINNSTVTVPITFTLDDSWVAENMELVVFVQNDDSKEILNGAKTKDFNSTSVNEKYQGTVKLFPNPTSGLVNVQLGTKIESITVSDYTGKTVLISQPAERSAQINMEGMPAGVYNFKVITEEGVAVRKVVVR